jgi:trans-aconitate 2-methyltransferase
VSSWDPEQYRRFADERAAPFHDLLALLRPGPIERAVDLGCGPGELTAFAAERVGAATMLGVDHSPEMLEAAKAHQSERVQFVHGDISAWTSDHDHDLVLAAASLQWVPDHAAVLARWTAALRPGGQLAVQMPANARAPTHTVAAAVAAIEPYRSAFGTEGPPPDPVARNVLAPEDYARLLYDLGYEEIHVHLRVYPHVLPSARHAVEWVKGTTLTRFRARLSEALYGQFLIDYEQALLEEMGDRSPCFFPFNRILFVARRPDRVRSRIATLHSLPVGRATSRP